MKKPVCLLLFVLSSFAAAPAFAQDVPPPPRPADAPAPVAAGRGGRGGPAQSIDAIAKSLQDTLNSIGRVSWTQTSRNKQTNAVTGPTPAWEEVTHIAVSPASCEMRVTWNSSGQGTTSSTYFLEEIGNVTVFASEATYNRANPALQFTMVPGPYSVSFSGGSDFKVRDISTADQIATALRQLQRPCRGLPPAAAASAPSLEATISFIADRLNSEGAVNWLATLQNTVANSSGSPVQMAMQNSAAGNFNSCLFTFHTKETAGGSVTESDETVNFHRVEKLAVMTMQDEANSEHARQGHPELQELISTAVFDLVVSGSANRTWNFPFTDEDLANRVAKAMLHATEICGGGKSLF